MKKTVDQLNAMFEEEDELVLTDAQIGRSALKGIPKSEAWKTMMRGRPKSEEWKRELSEILRNSDAVKSRPRTKRRAVSEETRRAISRAQTGKETWNKGKKMDEAYRKKCADAQTPEVRKRISDKKKGVPRPLMTCPYCGKEGGAGNMQRWHFENCKKK